MTSDGCNFSSGDRVGRYEPDAVLGKGLVNEIGRRHRMSDVTLAKLRDAFLAGGAAALANSGRCGQPSRGAHLETELEEIKAALCAAHTEVRVWRKKGGRSTASRTSS